MEQRCSLHSSVASSADETRPSSSIASAFSTDIDNPWPCSSSPKRSNAMSTMRRNSEPFPAELGCDLESLFPEHQQIEEPVADNICNKRRRHSDGFAMGMVNENEPMHVHVATSFSQQREHDPESQLQRPKKRKIQRIMSALPHRIISLSTKEKASKVDDTSSNRPHSPSKNEANEQPRSPHQAVLDAFAAKDKIKDVRPTLSVDNFFIQHTEEQIKSYDVQVIQAMRSQDIDQLRNMHKAGRQLQCANKFGESLIHMACRRGFVDVVRFLVDEAGVSVRVRDDYGRTALHDACWTSEPNEELVEYLIRQCPELLLMSDKRGSAPFEYVRREHWGRWLKFVQENEELLI